MILNVSTVRLRPFDTVVGVIFSMFQYMFLGNFCHRRVDSLLRKDVLFLNHGDHSSASFCSKQLEFFLKEKFPAGSSFCLLTFVSSL